MDHDLFTKKLIEMMRQPLDAPSLRGRELARAFVVAIGADDNAPVQFGIEQGRMVAWVKPSYQVYLTTRYGPRGSARFTHALDRIAALLN